MYSDTVSQSVCTSLRTIECSGQAQLCPAKLRNHFTTTREHHISEAGILILEIPFLRATLEICVECASNELISLREVGRRCAVRDNGIMHTRLKSHVSTLCGALVPDGAHALDDGFAGRLCGAVLEEVEKVLTSLQRGRSGTM
jgi:hypothetical protein